MVGAGGEQLLFVWRGAFSGYSTGEKDTVFIAVLAELEVSAVSGQETVVIQVQAPPVVL